MAAKDDSVTDQNSQNSIDFVDITQDNEDKDGEEGAKKKSLHDDIAVGLPDDVGNRPGERKPQADGAGGQ